MQDIENIKLDIINSIKSSDKPEDFLRFPKLKQLFDDIKNIDADKRADFGKNLNLAKQAIEAAVLARQAELEDKPLVDIDVTAPQDYNSKPVSLLDTIKGTKHPLTREIENVIDIFCRMGFEAIESRQIDDEEHMFDTLNFPKNHPARDGYDTFKTEDGFISPAHTSTMQNRILKAGKDKLEADGKIAAISYGRVFRNEDVNATHEHTFYQCEGVFVSKDANVGQMIGLLRSFFEAYYGQELRIKTQPSYFPFVEPGLEFAIERPTSLGGKPGEWLELLGCGMIHPNVLRSAGIDPDEYKGFAWGGGIDRLVMLKYGIEDLRLFESGKLAFLEKFV